MKHNQQAFIAAYNKLNPEQKKAVDTLSGPVIVNAGPGTGKTQILATRIGNILLKTDTDPNNILCLTYTDNGAVEMRNRLLSIIGLPAYGIRIHTFHSFCNEVIQDNISYFGKLNLEPIGDIEKIDLFAKLIDSIENDNILKRFKGDVYYEAPRMESLFSLMKKEAWDVEHMSSRIDKYISMLPEKEGFFYKRKYKEFNAGDPNPGKIETEKEKMEILRAAVKLYPRYNQMMSDINRYNFDDMILWVLDAFKKNKNILSDYQERFQFFLVDEFQDTSRSQNLLLEYLLSYWDNNPDVFVVGDADQSIFAFQDANVENIENFRKKYTGQITEINLVNNYRSTQIILDAAHELIKNNNGRTTGNDAPLKASGINNQHSTRFEIIEYPNSSQEAMGVALQIESLIHQNIKGSEIAVIYRNHAQVEQIISILDHKKIPVNTRRKADVLQLPFIQNIITLLTWIDKETTIPFSGDDLLFRILHFDFFAITPIQIARLSLLVNEKNNPGKTDKYYLRRIIAESKTSNGDLFNQPDNLVKETSNTLENLLKASGNLTVQHLIELVIQKAGALNYIMKSDEKPWLMQALNAFFNFVKDECKRNPSLTLHGVLTTISLMMKHRIR
ncbi:MAG: ATP-dependent helicase, partial [Bacteroidetes bacterium]|nr:ATP-dependent helicase [Bacteroidota bacterium]